MKLKHIEREFQAAKGPFKMFNPSISSLVRGPYYLVYKAFEISRAVIDLRKSNIEWPEVIGNELGTQFLMATRKPIRSRIKRVHRRIPNIPKQGLVHKNGLGARSWYNEPSRQDLVIIFHDANRAGPHIDVHIGRLSLIYRVKPDVYSQLRYNSSTGLLTENSRKLLIDHVKAEIANGSRVPQNLDHSKSNARSEWVNGSREGKNYGNGFTRQIILESKVDVVKAHANGPIEIFAPDLNPARGLYLYKIYPGDGKTAPICIFGQKTNQPPRLDDRLHLKMIDPADQARIEKNADLSTSTAKYDGSSCYIVINKKGTYVYSPRESKVHGKQIEYTYKLEGIHAITSQQDIVAMGELVFKPRPSDYGKILSKRPSLPWSRKSSDIYVSAATGSGFLNSNDLLPAGVVGEIRLYRVDRIGGNKVGDLPFWENRQYQYQVAALDPTHLKVVELMTPEEAKVRGYEGFVAVPEGHSVNDGIKVKWWQDANDWRIEEVAFKPGEKGGIAGVVWAESLESGKTFKLGPGQFGDRALVEDAMNHPDRYIGTVIKVRSREGHEGRAAKVLAVHQDKGSAPF